MLVDPLTVLALLKVWRVSQLYTIFYFYKKIEVYIEKEDRPKGIFLERDRIMMSYETGLNSIWLGESTISHTCITPTSSG